MKPVTLSVIGLALAAPALAQEETTMTTEEVPQAATDAAMARLEEAGLTATIDAVAMDDDEGTMTYELSGTMKDGMPVEVDVLEDGTVEEFERQIAVDALPAEVMAALKAELPGFQPFVSEESTRPDGTWSTSSRAPTSRRSTPRSTPTARASPRTRTPPDDPSVVKSGARPPRGPGLAMSASWLHSLHP